MRHGLARGLLPALLTGLLVSPWSAANTIFNSGFESDVAVADVTWAAETRLISGASDALLTADPAGGIFTFDTALLEANGPGLAIGNTLLIEGTALGRIETISDDGTTTTVTTSAATLADAIESGRLVWDMDIGFDEITKSKVRFGPKTCSPNIDGLTVSFECGFEDYTLTMSVTGGRNESTVQFVVVKGGDNANASFSGTGTISRFNQNADISYAAGDLENVDYATDGLQLDITLELAAAGSGSSDVRYEVPFPIFQIPFAVGPIPVSVDIGAQLLVVLQVPASATASAMAKADFSYNGNSGLTYEGASGNIAITAETNAVDFSNGSFDSASLFETVNAIFGMAVPRVSLNIFTAEVAYVLTGAVIRSTLYTGPICKEAETEIVVQGGYGLNILGVDLFTPEDVVLKREEFIVSQNGQEPCPQSGG